MRCDLETEGCAEERHYPLVNVLPWLDLFHFEVLTEVRQVYLEHLLVKLQGFGDEFFVESVERHHGVLQHEVGESLVALVFIPDVHQHDGREIAHALDVAYVRSVHCECFQQPVDALVVLHAILEQL